MSNNLDENGIDLGGRPHKDIDKKMFEGLCKIHCVKAEICAVLHCNEQTLSRWCHREYEMSFIDTFNELQLAGKASLRRLQWKKAEKLDNSMLKFLGVNILGQTERSTQEIKERIIYKTDASDKTEAELDKEMAEFDELIAETPNLETQ